jgi:hypothetical protein
LKVDLKLDPDSVGECEWELVQEIMIIYGYVIGQGYTIKGKIVKADTLELYFAAAAEFCTEAGCPVDPRYTVNKKAGATGKPVYTPALKIILDAMRRWEAMPNRQDPVTKGMVQEMLDQAGTRHQDSIYQALAEWCAIGLLTGYRRIEWAQENEKGQFQRAEDPGKSIYAVTANDLQFFGPDGRVMVDPEKAPEQEMHRVRITWKFQKNNKVNESISYVKNDDDPAFCAVTNFHRVLVRAMRLQIPNNEPLAVYRRFQGSARPTNIGVRSIVRVMNEAAKAVYGTDDLKQAGMSFTPHSLRIGACVLLHSQGMDKEMIKFRLRWCSDAFMAYLRDVPSLAAAHNQAMNSASLDNS